MENKYLHLSKRLFDIGMYKKWNLIILFFFLLCFTPSLFAVDLSVNGITTPYDANGTYLYQGQLSNGKDYWKLQTGTNTYYIYNDVFTGINYWYIDTDLNTDQDLFYGDDASSPTSVSTWTGGTASDLGVGTPTVAEYSNAPEINITGNGTSITSGATTPGYTDFTNFGTAVTGGGTATRTFTIQNTGLQALTIGTISFSGSSDFSVTTAPPSSVAASSSVTFVVTFTPSAVGNRTATISIGNNDSNENPYTFAISGYGFTAKNLAVSGSITPSEATGTYVYAGIKNNFAYWKHSTLNYYLYCFTNDNGIHFSWVLDNDLDKTGYLFSYTSSMTDAPPTVPTGLTWNTSTGTGTLSVTEAATVPEINIKAGTFDITNGYTIINFSHYTNFGTLDIASGTKKQSFTIENTGTGALTLNGTSPYITLSGTNASEFSVTKPPSNSIAAGSSTPFEITFDPSTIGTKTAVVNISNNDGDEGNYSFNIQGEAITAKSIIVSGITTPAAANGTYTYKGISNDFEYWENSSGYYVYNYRSSDITDPTWYIDADMSVTPSDATTYNFKSLNNIDDASPANVSSWSASSGSSGNPMIVFLEPEINVTGNSADIISGDNTPSLYDYTDLGWVVSGSISKTFTIQNTGVATLNLTGSSPYITFSGTDASQFSITSAPSATILPGGSTTFGVTFTPSSSTLGARTATLSIANDDSKKNPYTFSVQSGVGGLPSITSQAVSNIGTITATGNGTITGLGNPNPIDYGVCWNTTGTPTTSDNKLSKGATSTASSFTASMTGLTPNTTYHVRAYVTNNVSTVYGTEQTFTTLLPTITSATYNASTGALELTCTNISSGDVIAPSKITITGEGGETYTLTTSNVTASSSTSASITLNATDKAAINLILNKNGPSSTNGTTYNISAADDWDGNITAGDISDLTGNSITVSNVAVPAITSATYDASTGTLAVTGTGFLKLGGAGNDINVSMLSITGEGSATYTLTTSNVDVISGTAFSVVLNTTDKAAINTIVNKNGTSSTGGTTYNLAAAEDWATGADASITVADLTGNGITISNVAVPTITSATYDASTGTLVVTGTGFLKLSGSNNDINVSKLTITGEGSATYTLTTSNVDITSGTAFSVVLNATDKAAINTIVNKNGTSSTGGTTYNLAAAEDWAAGADASATVVDLTGNGITASNLASPTVSTQAVSSIGLITATGNGNITSLGTSNPTQYGVVWGTSLNPDISLTTKTAQGATSTGAFISSITELAAGITYHVRAYATNATGTSYGDDVTFTTLTPGTWTGTTNTDWSTPTNWAGGIIPTSSTDVIIPSSGVTNYPIIGASTGADCNNLTVNTGASLTIAATASGTGSLIVHGTSTGDVTVQSYLIKNIWHVVSSPTPLEPIGTFIDENKNYIQSTGSSPVYYGVMNYNEGTNSWNKGTSYFTIASTTQFGAGYGYGVLPIAANDVTISYKGTLASTTSNINVGLTNTGEGWNCIGNPYPSAIKMDDAADGTNNFIKENAVDASNLDASYACVYIWDGASSSYKILGNSPVSLSSGRYLSQNYVAPGQGFFVKAKGTGSPSVTFTPAMQSHQNSTALLKSARITWPAIRLNVINNSDTTSTIVAFNSAMTKGLDPTYDAGLLRGTTGLNLYSRLVNDNGVDFAIQCLPEKYDSLVIPLGVECKKGGDITFNAETVELPASCNVILEDKATKTFTSLDNGGSYTATVNAGSAGTGRFYLHTSSLSTVTDVPSQNADNAVNAYAKGKVIYITGSKLSGSDAKLYDISGRSINTYKLTTEGTVTLDESSLVNGVYVLHITSSGKAYAFKVILKD